MSYPADHDARRGPSRRRFLLGGAAAGWGAAIALGADAIASPAKPADTTGSGPAEPTQDTAGLRGSAVVPFYGAHQAGVSVSPQAHSTYLALDLHEGVDAEALGRLMRLLTSDAERLTQGRGALADMEPELAQNPRGSRSPSGSGPACSNVPGRHRPPGWRRCPRSGSTRCGRSGATATCSSRSPRTTPSRSRTPPARCSRAPAPSPPSGGSSTVSGTPTAAGRRAAPCAICSARWTAP